MALKDNLFPASFRGVPFDVRTSDLQVGRRTQAFEYPQRDKPFVEDLGRSARLVEVEAVIVGSDYIQRMNALIAAMEQRGAGTLVHPFLGEMVVTPQDATRVSFDTGGLGVATATLSFIESGDYEFPGATADALDAIQAASSGLSEACATSFLDSFSIDGLNDYGVATVVDSAKAFLGNAGLQSFFAETGLTELASDLTASLGTLVYDAEALANQATSLFSLSSLTGTTLGWSGIAKQLSRLCTSGFCHLRSFASPSLLAVDEIDNAATAVQSLFRQSMVAGLINAASMVGTDDDVQIGSAIKTASYDELMATLDGVLAVLDSEAVQPGTGDDVFLALQNARSATWDGIKTRAERRARLIDYIPAEVSPALVIAYDYYADARRDDEIVERNNIRHGGFVPANPIKLLSE